MEKYCLLYSVICENGKKSCKKWEILAQRDGFWQILYTSFIENGKISTILIHKHQKWNSILWGMDCILASPASLDLDFSRIIIIRTGGKRYPWKPGVVTNQVAKRIKHEPISSPLDTFLSVSLPWIRVFATCDWLCTENLLVWHHPKARVNEAGANQSYKLDLKTLDSTT